MMTLEEIKAKLAEWDKLMADPLEEAVGYWSARSGAGYAKEFAEAIRTLLLITEAAVQVVSSSYEDDYGDIQVNSDDAETLVVLVLSKLDIENVT